MIQRLQNELLDEADESGEIFLLLIGDHGGGTFKLLLQDLTEVKPNSPLSGFVVGEMEAVDNYENLKAAFSEFQVCRRVFLNFIFYLFFYDEKKKTISLKKKKKFFFFLVNRIRLTTSRIKRCMSLDSKEVFKARWFASSSGGTMSSFLRTTISRPQPAKISACGALQKRRIEETTPSQ